MRHKSRPHILRHQLEGDLFATQFLMSHDFDSYALKKICRDLGVPVTTRIAGMLNNLNPTLFNRQFDDDVARVILQHMVHKQRKWCVYRIGNVPVFRELASPFELVWKEGDKQWYGPLADLEDANVVWYIRPYFLPHYEFDENDETKVLRLQARGICLARVTRNLLSLHWHGYSISEDNPERVSGIKYWEFIPEFFDELEELLGCDLIQPQLEDLVLHKLWDHYCLVDEYVWDHTRIRAEAGGVALSAHSSLVTKNLEERDMLGIKHLANTLQRAVTQSVFDHGIELPEEIHLEDVILRTLIRSFGAKSYGFALQTNDNEKIVRAHVYFGSKPNHSNQDSFPHIRFYVGWHSVIEQLNFLVDHS